MRENTDNLLRGLEEQLSFINLETDNSIEKCELSIGVINTSLGELKDFIRQRKFKSLNEEINFFRSIKPKFYSKLIYFLKIYNIESKKPNGSDKAKKKHLKNELNEIEVFFNINLDFIKYIRTNKTYLDSKYFVRGKFDLSLSIDSFYFDADPFFSTSHDYKAAHLLANELLGIYLKAQMEELENADKPTNKNVALPKVKLNWTLPKASLIELIYSLHSLGAFNNTNISIKEIVTYFESVFNTDLGNFYNTFQEIRERKNNPTMFLDALKDNLLKKMDSMNSK